MSYGFGNINDTGKVYLKEAGLHQNVKYLGLKYEANENWEAFDIELETADGKYFRERTFGADVTKVYPKAKYAGGIKEGDETKEEAFERVKSEINKKLFHLASCFVDKTELTNKAASVKTFKELVDVVAKLIGEPTKTLNILTIWKNSEARQKSNLIIAEKIKWVEPYVEGRPASIKLTKYQLENQTTEKFPYKGTQEQAASDETIIPDSQPAGEELPF